MALVGAGGLSLMRAPDVSTDGTPVAPVLQAQDGSFVGSVSGDDGQRMVAFDQSGGVRWVVAGYRPQIALADGGVIATDDAGMAMRFDQGGGGVEALGVASYSWFGDGYVIGSVRNVFGRVSSSDRLRLGPERKFLGESHQCLLELVSTSPERASCGNEECRDGPYIDAQ
jgi:hypothetical protein